jgi:hypothetical protein
MLSRILFGLLGLVSTWTGCFAALHFDPPAYADPGAVNACWLTFILLIVCGWAFLLFSVRPR